MNYGPQDQTALRMQRVLGIPMGDGRVFQNGAIVSADDAARTDATRQQNASNAAQANQQAIQPASGMPVVPGSQVAGPQPAAPAQPVGPMDPAHAYASRPGAGIDVNSYPGSRYASPVMPGTGNVPGVGIDVTGYNGSRYDPSFAANNNAAPAADYQSQFIRQQLLELNGTAPGRVYTPATLAKATDAQVAGELAGEKMRNDFVGDFMKRTQDEDAANAGFGSYQAAAASVPPGSDTKVTQDAKTGRWLVETSTPKPTGGYATAAEAQASIPAGSKGQVSQTATGRYVVQYGVNDAPASPESPLAKLQADRARAQKEGRTDDVAALDAKIQAEASPVEKPLGLNEFLLSPELRKEFGNDYGRYRQGFTTMSRAATASATQPGGGAPKAVKTKAERDALPDGTLYVGPDGQTRRKTATVKK